MQTENNLFLKWYIQFYCGASRWRRNNKKRTNTKESDHRILCMYLLHF